MATKRLAEVRLLGPGSSLFEYAEEVDIEQPRWRDDLIDRAVRNSGLRASRSQERPDTVPAVVFLVRARDGRLHYEEIDRRAVGLPLEPLTAVTFEESQAEVLQPLPEEFRGFVAGFAYEKGHAYGFDEMLGIATGLTTDLQPVIEKYTARILEEERRPHV